MNSLYTFQVDTDFPADKYERYQSGALYQAVTDVGLLPQRVRNRFVLYVRRDEWRPRHVYGIFYQGKMYVREILADDV